MKLFGNPRTPIGKMLKRNGESEICPDDRHASASSLHQMEPVGGGVVSSFNGFESSAEYH